ncbi:regulatory LuxR family protein [Sphingomonas sp. PP-F2F-A104-K0414]|uniref:helix-turn-helix domain-containing protein n=1 Tax=Sphingomonas sp. PP-F2F-A104-K0414 TaxID=2135661 RepID=UPI00104ABC24|nr:helix-turn-helix transcriptional regulator [Sphingomonas sp. PP-F2F-A104-K0414]TCP95482.1 regulatory LuxR family protein [Sphingomonas sp. PP-F2F-A104-K0414]
MEEPRIDRLSNRHRDVLRGVAALRKTKQIAAELGIAPGTVDGYIADAVRILGATDRGDAARMLARHERIDPLSDPRPSGPGQSGGQSSWVAAPPASVPQIAQPVVEPEAFHDAGADRVSQDAGTHRVAPDTGTPQRPSFAGLLPIRRTGQRSNDLPVAARLLWIPAIAVILAVGFGMLASGLNVLAELIERIGHVSG